MNDTEFEQLTAKVAARTWKYNSVTVIQRDGGWLKEMCGKLSDCAVVQESVWGWRVKCAFRKNTNCIQILCEYLATKEDAVRVCEFLGLRHVVDEKFEPDPL